MNEVTYPIYYLDYHKCISCGANAVMPLDRKVYSNSMIYPITHMKCRKCGSEFYIRWIDDPEKENEKIPVCAGGNSFDKVAMKIIYEAKADLDKVKASFKK